MSTVHQYVQFRLASALLLLRMNIDDIREITKLVT